MNSHSASDACANVWSATPGHVNGVERNGASRGAAGGARGERRDGPRDRGRAGAPGAPCPGGVTARRSRASRRAWSRCGRTCTTPAEASRAIAGASVVYHAAQPAYDKWPGNFERLNASVGDAAASAGARLVFADNLYMYGPGSSPMRETTPQRATDRKGAQRIRLAAALLARHERGELEVAIGRSSDYFGPHGTNSGAGERAFGALVAGKSAAATGRIDRRALVQLPAGPRPGDGRPR